MGRRDAVEVPRRRLGRAVGGAARGCDRNPVLRQSALRAGRARAPRDGPLGRRGRRAADGGRRRARTAAARHRRRRRPRRDVHRLGVPRLGRRARRRRLRGTGQHPRLGRDGRRPGEHLRRPPRAGRSRSGCSTASRPPRRRAETGAASSPLRCSWSSATAATRACRTRSSTSGSTTTSARSRSYGACIGLHQALFGKTPRDEWLAVDERLRAEIGERLAATRPCDARRTGPGSRTWRSASTAATAIDPVVLEALREAR